MYKTGTWRNVRHEAIHLCQHQMSTQSGKAKQLTMQELEYTFEHLRLLPSGYLRHCN